MAVLSLWLPPFAPDYSGVSSVFFELPSVTVIHDASGCTGNYTGYDEPRWYGSKAGVFCSGLRELDAVLGDDEKVMLKIERACRDLKSRMTALVGSPVPMVIGSDLEGMAREVEARTGLPSFGFATTGTDYYDEGVARALEALVDRFARPGARRRRTVNILGLSPLDFSCPDVARRMKELSDARGYEVLASMAMDWGLEDIEASGQAAVNLVVSRSGIRAARLMKRRFGIPWLCAYPAGSLAVASLSRWLKELEEGGDATHFGTAGQPCDEARILILGEQIHASGLRWALNNQYGQAAVAVGCPFGMESDLTLPQDRRLKDESAIMQEMNRPQYRVVIGDPLFRQLLRRDDTLFIDCPHFAVSSKESGIEAVDTLGSAFDRWIERRLPLGK